MLDRTYEKCVYQKRSNCAYLKNSVHELFKVCTKQAIHNTYKSYWVETTLYSCRRPKVLLLKRNTSFPCSRVEDPQHLQYLSFKRGDRQVRQGNGLHQHRTSHRFATLDSINYLNTQPTLFTEARFQYSTCSD